MIAITRAVSPNLAHCQLTHLDRVPLDTERAASQHAAYEDTLVGLGLEVVRAPAAPHLPDGVFVEDTAVVLDEVAVLTRPGAPERRPEVEGVGPILAAHRPVETIRAPGTLDGGDVLVVGRQVYVGLSTRTNVEGVDQLRAVLAPHGYRVATVPVTRCLHLKSAATPLSPDAVLINPAWVDPNVFSGLEAVEVDPAEQDGANVLALGKAVVASARYRRTLERLGSRGWTVHPVDLSELAKAEGAVTCCSLLIR